MLIDIKNGQTSVVLRVKLRDSSVTTGAGLTGLTHSSTGMIISTIADNEATATAYTVAASNVETITTLGTYAAPTASKCRFKEVDATNHPGVYEIHLANARFAVASAKSLLVSIVGATNLVQTDILIPLRSVDPYDAVRGGMTALPNAVAEASGGLVTRGTGTGQLSVSSGAVILASAGLDAVVVETGINARQALSAAAAATAGVLSGAGTNSIIIKGAGVATTRITATTDGDGNRSSVTLNLPA